MHSRTRARRCRHTIKKIVCGPRGFLLFGVSTISQVEGRVRLAWFVQNHFCVLRVWPVRLEINVPDHTTRAVWASSVTSHHSLFEVCRKAPKRCRFLPVCAGQRRGRAHRKVSCPPRAHTLPCSQRCGIDLLKSTAFCRPPAGPALASQRAPTRCQRLSVRAPRARAGDGSREPSLAGVLRRLYDSLQRRSSACVSSSSFTGLHLVRGWRATAVPAHHCRPPLFANSSRVPRTLASLTRSTWC